MKVSIVIPVYNVEKYLEVCLDSVLEQAYTDYEVILVDDGSTDRSSQICDAYAQQDTRFRVIHQKNGGLSNARNNGAKAATGDYVFFLDSDDCIHPSLLQKMAHIAEEYQAALVQIDFEMVPEEFADYKKNIEAEEKVFAFDTVEAFYNIDKDNKQIAQDIRLITTVVWSKLYRRDLLEKVNFPEDIKLHEDQMVAHRFIVEAGGLVFCRAPLYFYRKRSNSLITEGWTVKRLTILDCYRDRVEWAKRIKAETNRVEGLVYYIYVRYLVCMFKNYWMISKRLNGDEKKKYQNQVIQRYRAEMKSSGIRLKLKDRFVFSMFSMFPNMFVKIYQAVRDLLHKD